MLGAEEHPAHVDAEHPVEEFRFGLGEGARRHPQTGVQNRDIDAAIRLARGGVHPLVIGLLADIDGYEPRRAAGRGDIVGHAAAVLFIDVRHDHPRALARVASGDPLAEARTAAGDDRRLAIEPTRHLVPPVRAVPPPVGSGASDRSRTDDLLSHSQAL